MANPTEIDLTALKKKWGVYKLVDLGTRCAENGGSEYLIEELFPVRSLSVVVGDSGLGKSPLLYQAGLSIAGGIPFLGKAVRQGRVLYIDSENSLGAVDEMTQRLCYFLGLNQPPGDFIGWNLNDCPTNWMTQGHGPAELIHDVSPDLVIIDPVTALWPNIQERNKDTAEIYQLLRRIMREAKTAVVLVHHIKKSSERMVCSIADGGDLRTWFQNARGPGQIINGVDVRLAVDLPGAHSPGDAALVVGGFGRVRGTLPLMHLQRIVDQHGDPLGYERMVGVSLLPQDQRRPFEQLPDMFRHKEAKQIYGKGSQATTDWIGKCIAAGILQKKNGVYVKVSQPVAPIAA